MKSRQLLTTIVLGVALVLSAGSARAQDAQSCQPGLVGAITGPHAAQYQGIINALIPFAGAVFTQLPQVVNQATCQPLLDTANALAASVATGRVVITLPDGTVMIDTNRDDNTASPTSNSYQHFLDKTINENHNSRVAILATQEYPCGVAVESKLSTSTGMTEAYVALRVGTHLDSDGTIRVSTRQ